MSNGLKELVILAEYLAMQGLGKVTGSAKTIYVNHMPASVTKGILLRQDYLGIQIVPELPGYFKTTFQVILRNPDMQDGADLAERVSAALTQERKVIGEMTVNYLRPRHKPIPYPASKGDQFEFLVNVDACYLLV
jgi:hypothetical protein